LADTDEGDLLVRVPGRDADPEYMRGSIVAARLAAEVGIPTPRLRAFAAESEIGRPVVVQEFRPGEQATTAIERDPDKAVVFGAAVGDWIGRLHGVHGEYFGGILGSERHADWSSAAGAEVAKALGGLETEALPAPSRQIENVFDRLIGQCPKDRPASLIHGDLYFDNVLAVDGAPAGLLDFEHARFADRFAEFGKLGELLFEWWPASREPFLKAYRRHIPAEPEDDVRTRLAIGIYELGQLAYFQRWQQDLVPVYQARLNSWLEAQ